MGFGIGLVRALDIVGWSDYFSRYKLKYQLTDLPGQIGHDLLKNRASDNSTVSGWMSSIETVKRWITGNVPKKLHTGSSFNRFPCVLIA